MYDNEIDLFLKLASAIQARYTISWLKLLYWFV